MSTNLFKRVQRAGERARLLRKDDPRAKDRRIKEIIASCFARSKNKGKAIPDMTRMSDAELLKIIGTDEANYPLVKEKFIHLCRSARKDETAKE
jgi:hypothetical protein